MQLIKDSFYLVQFSLLSVLTTINSVGAESINNQSNFLSTTQIKETQPQISTSAQDLLAQQNSLTRVTGIEVNQNNKGLEIILKTSAGGQKLVPLILPEGNKLAIDILNATLASSIRNGVTKSNPAPGINQVRLTKIDENSIRLTITGKTQAPSAEIIPSQQNLVLSVNPQGTTAQSTPSEEIEVLATGERENSPYLPDNNTTATKTDTPQRDIPQSIQIVPRQIIEDRQIRRVQEIADNVPGVINNYSYGGLSSASFLIRGFDSQTTYRDGFADFDFVTPFEVTGVEQVEILKGPGSALYGQNQPGGIVNLVSKKPLTEPYYAAEFTVGSDQSYRPTLDISDALNKDKTVAYRLNLAYENSESHIDFIESESFFVAPAFSWQIGKNTKVNFNFEYQNYDYTFDRSLPGINESFDVPISRFVGEPDFNNAKVNAGRASYVLEHEFNSNWKFRNGLYFVTSQIDSAYTSNGSLVDGLLERNAEKSDEQSINLAFQNELVGKFNTASIEHQLLLGAQYSYSRFEYDFLGATIDPINFFNPVYGAKPGNFTPSFGEKQSTNVFAFYLQDQIKLFDNLKILAGGRLDIADSNYEDTLNDEELVNNSDTAFTPRVGIVYQPIAPISLYASYASSFNPDIFSRSRTGETFEPEEGEQYEIGIKTDIIRDRLASTLAFYDITKQNVAVTDPVDADFNIQTGEQKSRGIELDLTGTPVKGWNIIFGYAYTDAFINKDTTIPIDDRLAGVPEHQIGLWNSYEIQKGKLKGLGVGLGLYYVSQREGNLPNDNVELPGYFRVDSSLFYKQDNWKVQLGIDNLTDIEYYNTYEGSSVIPQAPLTILGTVSVKF
ncbi:MAG: TonB-dependent siderophore receptor [Waterburya sp.]